MRERGNGEPEEEVDDVEHVVADAAVAERGEHGGELAAGLLLVVQRVEHGEADGVLFGGLGVRRGEKKGTLGSSMSRMSSLSWFAWSLLQARLCSKAEIVVRPCCFTMRPSSDASEMCRFAESSSSL